MTRTAIIPSRPEEDVIITPTYLRTARQLLGLSQGQVASLLNVKEGEARDLERSRTHFIYDGQAVLLTRMLRRVNKQLEQDMTGEPPEFLFCYPNDPVFEIMEPELAGWMKFATVHQMYVARLFDGWSENDHEPTVVEIVPAQYDEFLGGEEDTLERRIAWAREHVKVYRMRTGMPGQDRGKITREARGE